MRWETLASADRVPCAESEQILTPGSPAAEKASLREVFGATEEDVDKLRIVSLYEVQPFSDGRLLCWRQ